MFILRRFLAFIPVALIVALIVFLMLHLSPGDPVAAIAGDSATAADIARIRAELGLDDPLPEQFVRWCMELIQGDLGRSYFLNRPVADLIADRVGPTLSLAGFTIVLTVLIAVPLGAWAAYRQGGWVDRALMGFSVLGFSIPSFVLGYCFVWLFGLKLNLLPSQGYVRYDESIEGWISHLILPSLTLCCIYVALIARVTRASVAEMLTEDPLGGCRDDARDGWLYVHSGYPLRDQFDRYVRQRFGHRGDRHRHSEYSAHCPTGALRCAVGARGTLR